MKNQFRKPKYTQGPWETMYDTERDWSIVVIGKTIAQNNIEETDTGNISIDESNANALLISKAPEMYEGLTKLVDYIRFSVDLGDQPVGFVNIRELIEKLKKDLS